MKHRPLHRTLKVLATTAATVGVLLISACTATTDTGSSNSAAASTDAAGAQAAIDAASAVPAFSTTSPPIDVSRLSGKKVFMVPLASSPQNDAIQRAMETVAGQTGIELTLCSNQGQTAQWSQCLDQAVSTRQDVIVLEADPSVLGPQISAAKAAGIPILSLRFFPEDVTPDDPACKGCQAGITAVQSGPIKTAARLMVDWAIADGKGDVNAIVPMMAGLPPTDAMKGAMDAEFAEKCPECTYKYLDISMQDALGAGFQTALSSTLNTNAKANYVLNETDFLAPAAIAALNLSGRGDISMTGYNGIAPALALIAQGTPFAMDVGEPAEWVGYQAMDNVFRLLLGDTVTSGVATPVRVWTKANIAEAGDPPTPTGGYGDSYVAGFEKLWGLR